MTRLLGPLVPDVVEVVLELTGIPREEMMRKGGRGDRSRTRTSQARLIAYWVARQFGASYKEIGAFFDRDHTTVVSGVQRVESDASGLMAIAMEVACAVQERYGALPAVLRAERAPVKR